MRSAHHHPCFTCGVKTACHGTITQNYDGTPDWICEDFHTLALSEVGRNPDFICGACNEQELAAEDAARAAVAAQTVRDQDVTSVLVTLPFVTEFGVAEMRWSCARATARKDGGTLTVTTLDGDVAQVFNAEKPWLRATVQRADGTRIATVINEHYGIAARSTTPAA